MNFYDLRVPCPLSMTVTHTGSAEDVTFLGALAPGDLGSTVKPGKAGNWKLSSDTDRSSGMPLPLPLIGRKSVPFAQLGQACSSHLSLPLSVGGLLALDSIS